MDHLFPGVLLEIDTWLLDQHESTPTESSRRPRRSTRQRNQANVPKPRFGSRHQVVLRSDDRLDPLEYELSKRWQHKWSLVRDEMNKLDQSVFSSDIFKQQDVTKIYSFGEQAHTLGIQLNQPLSSLDDMSPIELFETLLLETDLPLALWMRCAKDVVDYQGKLNQLLQVCCLARLLETLREKRAEVPDLEPEQQAGHLCSHLALLWDDPTIQPPIPA